MTPDLWQQVEALFAASSQLPPAERAAYLDRSCTHPEVRREVESLLQFSAPEGDDLSRFVQEARASLIEIPPAPPRELSGRMLGPYRVVNLIGQGGMGEIYAAEDSRLGRQVALKLLYPLATESPSAVQRFHREARAASALNHPNIVTIHDAGQAEGIYYIATELVQGKTLRQVMDEQAMPVRQVLAIAIQIAGALATAHRAGIVHRDIKPENLMLRTDGYIKILDFGLAKLSRLGARPDDLPLANTRPGMVMGTVRYMSPEQARGLETDGRSDLFSFGAVLYEMAARRPAFRGETGADLLTTILHIEPAPLCSLVPAIPPRLEAIVGRCLCKDLAQRYQTAEELLKDLTELKEDVDTSSGTAARAVEPPKRDGRRLIAACLAIAVLGALSIWMLARTGGTQRAWYQASMMTTVEGEGENNYGVLSPDGRYIGSFSILPDGKRALSVRLLTGTSGVQVVPPAVVTYYGLAFSPDSRYLYYVAHKFESGDNGALFRVATLGGPAQKLLEDIAGGLSFSPDGSALAFVRRGNSVSTLVTVAPDGSGARELLHSAATLAFAGVDWGPDGKIYYGEVTRDAKGLSSRIFAIPATGGTPQVAADLGGAPLNGMVVLPDNSGFAVAARATGETLPQLWYVPRNGPMRRITHDLSFYHGISMTRDGSKLLTTHSERESQLWILPFNAPEQVHPITDPRRRFDSPAWTRSGQILSSLVLAGTASLWTLTPDGRNQRQLLQEPHQEIQPSTCPDRDDVVFVVTRNGTSTIWRARTDGSESRQLTSGESDQFPRCLPGGVVVYRKMQDARPVSMQVPLDGGAPVPSLELKYTEWVSPDGQFVLSSEGNASVRKRDGAVVKTFSFSMNSAAWSPDAKGFVYEGRSGGTSELSYQALAGGPPRQLTHFGAREIFDLSWSADGRELVLARGRVVADMVLIQDVR